MSDAKMNFNIYQLVDGDQLEIPFENPFASIFMPFPQEGTEEEAKPPASPTDTDSNDGDASPATRKGKRRADFVDTEERWSSEVKEKQKRCKRTGQACDRCKMRKLRCDSAAGGCLNCTAAHQRCMVTDRTTGETLERGQGPRLKAENDMLLERVAELEEENVRLAEENAQLRADLGVCRAHLKAYGVHYEG